MGKKEPREDKFPSNYFETLLKTRLTPKISSFFSPMLSSRTSKKTQTAGSLAKTLKMFYANTSAVKHCGSGAVLLINSALVKCDGPFYILIIWLLYSRSHMAVL